VNKLNPGRLLDGLSKGVYAVASIGLVVVALIMIIDGLREVYQAIRHFASEFTYVLDGVGLIVVAVAIFEVGKYLLEEEVLRPRDQHSPAEARESLTKFLTILIIVTGIEAMMLIFKAVGKQDFKSLVYPGVLILAIAAALVGLGAYQRLSEPSVQADNDQD
jgi:uncharacterized membrane protein HdeD (DUF308 family)